MHILYRPELHLLIAIGVFSWQFALEPFSTVQIVGALITFLGIGLWIVARRQLGQSFSINPEARTLVRHGLYAKIRHPIYVFSTIAAFGVTIFFASAYLLVLVILLVSLEIYRAGKEEKVLYEKFDNEYLKYKEQTWF